MSETVKIEGGGDGILIAGGAVIFLIIISLIVWAMNPDMFKKKEGDKCEIEDGDIRGTYEIDKEGKCVLKKCDTGWEVLGDGCTKTIEDDNVPPSGPPSGPPAASQNSIIISGLGNYIESKNKYVGAGGALSSDAGWTPGVVGEGGDITRCGWQCNGSVACLGFNVIDDTCYYKTVNTPKTDGPYTDDQGNKYPANYYGKPPATSGQGNEVNPLVITGLGNYIESKDKYVGAGGALSSDEGWTPGVVGEGGDITRCGWQCNGSDACLGFNVINGMCYHKTANTPLVKGPYKDFKSTYGASYYGKPPETPGQGNYVKLQGDSDGNSYVNTVVPESWGWEMTRVGEGGDISGCVEQCNSSVACLGFNVIDDTCSFKSVDTPVVNGPYKDEQGKDYPANYYGKPK